MGTRFETSTTGIISIDKVSSAWYINLSNVASATISNSAICSSIVANNARAVVFSNVVVGIVATTDVQSSLLCRNNKSLTITDLYLVRYNYSQNPTITGANNAVITNMKTMTVTARGTSGANSVTLTMSNSTISNSTCIGGKLNIDACANITVNNLTFCDRVVGTTDTSNGISAIGIATSSDITINGLNFGGITNIHPYDYFINVATSLNVSVKNIGSFASRLSLGTVNVSAGFINISGTNTYNTNTILKRIYLSGTPRTKLLTAGNTSDTLLVENVWSDVASLTISPSPITLQKGFYGNSTPVTNAGCGTSNTLKLSVPS
jgi:hypothetical protein